jgi:hypothetical protein
MADNLKRKSDLNFWWPQHDVVEFKVPVTEGKVILPHDFLVPGYVPDTTELWYNFVHSRKDRRKIADFSGKNSSAFFVNEKAFEIFEDMFLENGRAYSVRCSDKRHFIILVDKIHDAIDLARSKFDRSDIEKRVEDDISRFHRIALRTDFDCRDDIFRLHGSFALNSVLIVSNKFKQRYDASDLTGLYFLRTDGRK